MNYLQSLLELIKNKKDISNDGIISLSLGEIADAWNRTVTYKDEKYAFITEPMTRIDHHFLDDVVSAIKKIEKDGIVIFKFLSTESPRPFEPIKSSAGGRDIIDDFDRYSISTITNLWSLRDEIILEVKNGEPKNKSGAEIKLEGSKPIFDNNKSVIYWNNTECPIPPQTNQFFFCEKLFSEPFGKRIKEIEILDLIDWDKDTKRSVYDAMRAVNKRIKEVFGVEKFFNWRNNHTWINEKFIGL